jgi:RNA polymerase sigma-70 factor, ECF subfamily
VAIERIDQGILDDLHASADRSSERRVAFAQLHAELRPTVVRFAQRLIGTFGDADDIVQKSFTAFWINIDQIKSADSVIPFLYRIVRNLCFDELRRQRRYEHHSLDDDHADWADEAALFKINDTHLPDDALHWVETCRKVQRAINRLPERQRQAMILYAEENLTYEQVAEVMSIGIGSVKSCINHARKNLRKLLNPEVLRELGMNKEGEDG